MELKAQQQEVRYYDTDEAADYLTNQRRVRTAAQTLAKYRSIGGVQDFSTSPLPKYREDWLDQYANSRISAPKRSTSEAA